MDHQFKEKSDLQLVSLYKDTGEGRYVGELYKRYTKMVFVLCCKYLKDESFADDAVQLIFEKLLVILPKYKIDNFKCWLVSVTRNSCFLFLRRNKDMVEYCDFFEKNLDDFVEFDEILNQENREDKERTFQKLEAALTKLPEEQAECVRLFYLCGKSYAEISSDTGYSFNMIKSYIQNGRRNLKKMMGVSCLLLGSIFYSIHQHLF
ncbi:MAG: sigma-70 family RNA polymerase sigma factor [Bacteroidales bacterium]|nr:sigma-70 family RNA polymerase sigma factor [Bacteroidales bacterium]